MQHHQGPQRCSLLRAYSEFGRSIRNPETKRAAVQAATAPGLRAKAAMDAGQLVDDAIVIGIVEQRLAQADAAAGFVLDGFPRNAAQASILDVTLFRIGQPPLGRVLYLQVDEDEILRRLLARGAAEGRSDDNEATIRRRLQVYQAETRPLLDYYEAQRKLHGFAGSGDVDAIFGRLLSALETG